VYCAPGKGISHEWWSRDGRICYVHYDLGAYECDTASRKHQHVWREPLCHAHCDAQRRSWCADESPYKWAQKPCEVLFFDRAGGRKIAIASGLPEPPLRRKSYHLDPHPQFSPRGTWVVYTTTVRGMVDVALAPTARIVAEMG